MFANIGDLTSIVISSEKNLHLQFLNLKYIQCFFNQSLPKLPMQLNANEPDFGRSFDIINCF